MFDKYRVKKNSTRITVQPEDMFQDWSYVIDKTQWGIFGVFYGNWLDTERNKPLREARKSELIASGMTKKEAQKQATEEIRWKIYGWGVKRNIDPYDSFEHGYVFYHKHNQLILQVVEINANDIFVAEMDINAKKYIGFYSTSPVDLAYELMDGNYCRMKKDSPMRMVECTLKYVINADINALNEPLVTNQS